MTDQPDYSFLTPRRMPTLRIAVQPTLSNALYRLQSFEYFDPDQDALIAPFAGRWLTWAELKPIFDSLRSMTSLDVVYFDAHPIPAESSNDLS